MYITNPRGRRNLMRPNAAMNSNNQSRSSKTNAQNSDSPTMATQSTSPAPQAQPQVQSRPQLRQQQQLQPQAPQMSGTGYVVVRVTTASGAIPLEDALVVVTDYNRTSDIITAKKTNISGLTEKISLPAPAKSNSLSPGNGRSYSTYNIEVTKGGYQTQSYINVPVFDGITAVQSADLVPLPENGETDRATPYNSGIFYENENQFLGGNTESK